MLKGKTIYIPPVDYDGARVLAAVFRAAGVKAHALPPSDEQTREVRDRFTSGDECHPFQILTGDVMKLLEGGDVDPGQAVFFLPAYDGPCRVIRFAPDLREILESSGYGQAEIFAPRPGDAYGYLKELGEGCVRTAWRALVSADILRKLLTLCRPYEIVKGDTDKVYEGSLRELCATIQTAPAAPLAQFEAIRSALRSIRRRFHAIPVKKERSMPLIGIVGEVFCRFNALLNNDFIRQLEDRGGQARLTGLTEEVRRFVRPTPRVLERLGRDEVGLNELFHDDFSACREPHMGEVMGLARSYVPGERGFTEMALRLGQVVFMAKQGVDGIIDVSPFPCMNASACAAFYPRLSRELDGLPIRNFYFNGGKLDWSAALDEYLGAVRAYRERKAQRRM
jgi:predicted nucleotide-binding protein (sugar kinase/HSP70/actin superfamily)